MTLRGSVLKLKKKARALLSRPSVPEYERNEVGSERAEPTSSHLLPNLHAGVAEDGEDANPRVGESSGMQDS